MSWFNPKPKYLIELTGYSINVSPKDGFLTPRVSYTVNGKVSGGVSLRFKAESNKHHQLSYEVLPGAQLSKEFADLSHEDRAALANEIRVQIKEQVFHLLEKAGVVLNP